MRYSGHKYFSKTRIRKTQNRFSTHQLEIVFKVCTEKSETSNKFVYQMHIIQANKMQYDGQ